ncbi:MAG: alpha/beta hydrolase [Pseudomonadales bacterium]
MKNRIDIFGSDGEPVFFAHANGLPPGSYRQLFDVLAPEYQILGIRHRPLWSESLPEAVDSWHHLTDDLLDTIKSQWQSPVWLMGHSMGATTAMFAASREPELFKGLVLLDPVFMPRRRINMMRITPRAKRQRMPLIQKTLQRPHQWPDRQSAFDFHRKARTFRDMSDESLWDYIIAGTVEDGESGVRLAYSKYWEAHVFDSAPYVWRQLRKIELPILGMRGELSDTLALPAWQRWQRFTPQGRFVELAGAGHLFPLEQPVVTAREIKAYLLS